MCDPITMTLVAVSAYGSIQMGKAQKAQAEYQGAIARRQAEIQNAQLEEDLKIAEIRAHDEEQIRKDKMREMVYCGSGWSVVTQCSTCFIGVFAV